MEIRKKDPLKFMSIFAGSVLFLSGILFIYLYLHPGPHVQATRGIQNEIAETLGATGFWLFGIIYGRSLLKILLKNGPLLQRFIPDTHYEQSLSVSKKILLFLNRTHKYVGASAMVVFISHALLMGTNRWNLFLVLVLFFLVWQGVFGIFLLFRFRAKSLKKYSYLVHAQLFTGILIAFFAGLGHLLVP